MNSLWIAIGSFALLILALEWSMFRIFCIKTCRLRFPAETDSMLLKFFTKIRIRIFAVCHSVLLLAIVIVFYVLLW
ncbi:MAG: hypothetical protein V1926_05690 [Candidatus Peregrinibacteria bacterium]